MTGIIVKQFYLIPRGSKTNKKRNKFIAEKHGALVLNGEFAERIRSIIGGNRDGLIGVTTIPLKELLQLRDECAGHNRRAYETMNAIIHQNFLVEDIERESADRT
ncbi:VHS1034 protein [Vibrio phage 1]|nr:VHS1034 protein [Vibrio phage 1]